MGTAYVFLADGFEEIEALAPVDMLKRAEIPVKTVGVTGETVVGAHGIQVIADLEGDDFLLPEDALLILLPGGGTGTDNLAASKMVANVLQSATKHDIIISAICAAPRVLHKAGLLNDKRVTAFPGVQKELVNSHVTGTAVEVDGRIITGRSAGVALQFGHALISAIKGKNTADTVLASMYPEV